MTAADTTAREKFAAELRENVIAIELHAPRLPRSRQLASADRREVAEHFGAQQRQVSAGKSLYAPGQQEIRAIAGAINDARAEWQRLTIYYRRGARLLQKARLDQWRGAVDSANDRLAAALADADQNREQILARAAAYLGDRLFSVTDYPAAFADSIKISWSVLNFEPAEELLRLAPRTYEAEQARVRRQFELAIEAYEAEAREQFAGLVRALLEKLEGAAQGKRVVYTEAATTNLREFFARYDELGIRTDEELTALVSRAQQSLGASEMADFRKSASLRAYTREDFSAIESRLTGLIIEAPTRSIDLTDLD